MKLNRMMVASLARAICVRPMVATMHLCFSRRRPGEEEPGLGHGTADTTMGVGCGRQSFNQQTIYLRKDFSLASPIKSAKLYTTCDNKMTLWINGKEAGTSPDWPQPITNEVTEQLVVGNNTIAVRAQNEGGVAAFVFKLVGGSW